MKSIYSYMACAMVAQLLSANLCNAQTAAELKAAPAGVAIDGDAKEWGEMAFTDAKTKLSYTLANDKDNLYLVIKTKDPVQISSILGAGVTFGVDPKGKKRPSSSITFPVLSSSDNSSYLDMQPAQIKMRAENAKYGKITVDGFKDISDDQIITANTYGIQIATSYDAGGNLVFEEVIPISLFHAADFIGKEWTYNIKLAPVQGVERHNDIKAKKVDFSGLKKTNVKPVGGDVFSGDAAGSIVDLTPNINIGGKFILAKAQ